MAMDVFIYNNNCVTPNDFKIFMKYFTPMSFYVNSNYLNGSMQIAMLYQTADHDASKLGRTFSIILSSTSEGSGIS